MFSFIYFIVITIRDFCYKTGLKKVKKVNIPIISLGNITWGGNCKTSLAILIAEKFKNFKIAVITKGYGEDEVLLLNKSLNFPNVKVFVAKDRQKILEEISSSFDLAILDDGYQYRKVKKDLEILLLNGQFPFGDGCLIPAGILRETKSAIKRANLIIFTHTKEVPTKLIKSVENKNKQVKILSAYYKPLHFLDLKDNIYNLNTLNNREVACFSAIAYPKGFIDILTSLDVSLSLKFIYPDHYDLNEQEFRLIEAKCKESNIEDLIITAKDQFRFKFTTYLDIYVLEVKINLNEKICFFNKIAQLLNNNQ